MTTKAAEVSANVTASLASASGTRKCAVCGNIISDRSVIVIADDSRVSNVLVFHPECARALADALNACSGVIKL